MTTPADLHDRLDAVAALGVPDPTTDLLEPGSAWNRGLRFRRRRRIGTVAIVTLALALLIGLGGVAFGQRDTTITPAGSDAPAGLPDRFFEPSPWLAGTDDEGPLGQLAVLIPAQRKDLLGRSEDALVGISATTGEYRFLDLPDRAEGGELSPDGRKVAYWAMGPVTGTPNTSGGQSLVAGGLAVYDSASGETTQALIESEHGLAVDDIHWVDDDTLTVGYGEYTVGDEAEDSPLGTGRSTWTRWSVWSVGDEGPTMGRLLSADRQVDAAARGRVLANRTVVDVASGREEKLRFRAPLLHVTALDPTGTRVALPGEGGANDRTPNTLQVTAVDGTTTIVPGSEDTYAAIAWVDETHVAVQYAREPGLIEDLRVVIVDIEDGSRHQVIAANGVGGNVFQLATDLLSEPTLDAVEPPHPLDPRWVTGGLLLIVVAAGLALLRWRRHVAA